MYVFPVLGQYQHFKICWSSTTCTLIFVTIIYGFCRHIPCIGGINGKWRKPKKKMEGKQAGDGRLRSKSAEGNREEVQRQERYHSVKYWLLCLPALPLPTFSSPCFCSLSDQLLLIKILTAALRGSPSSSLPIPPSLSASPVAMSLFFLLWRRAVSACCHQQLKHLVFSFSSHLLSHLSTYFHLLSVFSFQTSIFASSPWYLTLISPLPLLVRFL